MNKKILFRILLDIILAFFVLNGWWVPALVLALIAMFLFPYFVEIIIAGVAYDALFGMLPGMFLGGYAGTIVTVILYTAIVFGKKLVR